MISMISDADIYSLKVRQYETISKIGPKIDKARKFSANGPLALNYRKQQLRNLYYAVLDNQKILEQALELDLHRPGTLTELLEIAGILDEINNAINNLDKWAAPKKTEFNIKCFASGPKLVPEPYGLVLVIGPWNYPYLCSIAPVINAIAAGNCVVLKPSEMVPHAAEAMMDVLEAALDPEIYTSIHGGVEETTELLTNKFDKICFTGSPGVGRIVSIAAAKHLTPCLLELGGKCPTIIDSTADLKLAARRIVWGKFVNAGQTCIAPDYIIIERNVHDEFVRELNDAITTQYPNLDKDTPEFTHIVSERLWNRANDLVESTKGVVYQHGTPDEDSLFFPPTVVTDVYSKDELMQDELFGPILPIICVDSASDANHLIKNHDTPLAMYIFSKDKRLISQLQVIRSGAVLINDTLMHAASSSIPFGGIGNSGEGAYHGKYGFDAFSHSRPILNQPAYMERLLDFRYPPFTKSKKKMVTKMSVPMGVWFPRQGPVEKSFWRKFF